MLHRSLRHFICLYILLGCLSAFACDCSFNTAQLHLLKGKTLYRDAHVFLSLSPRFDNLPLEVELKELESGQLLLSTQTSYSQLEGRLIKVKPKARLDADKIYQVIVKFVDNSEKRILFIDSFRAISQLSPEIPNAPYLYGYAHSEGDFCNGETLHLEVEAPAFEDAIYRVSSPKNLFRPVYVFTNSNHAGRNIIGLGDFQCAANFSVPKNEVDLKIEAVSWTGRQSPAIPLKMNLRNPEANWLACRYSFEDSFEDSAACFKCLYNPFCRVE